MWSEIKISNHIPYTFILLQIYTLIKYQNSGNKHKTYRYTQKKLLPTRTKIEKLLLFYIKIVNTEEISELILYYWDIQDLLK